jgi:hypothetical protein
METLTKTMQGRLEAFNAKSELADDLRLLLKFVDGKRTSRDLQHALKPHICSPKNIQRLIQMGLVNETSSAVQSAPREALSAHAYSPTVPASLSAMPPKEPATAQEEPSYDDDSQASSFAEGQLQDAKACMENFLLTSAPEIALQLLGDIENISTHKQLQASLDAYEKLIQYTGKACEKHLAELHEILNGTVYSGGERTA